MLYLMPDSKLIKDYYKILGLKRTASTEEIKEAYMRLVKKYHPDINHGNEAASVLFNEINEAYSVLGNLETRLDYSLALYMQDDIRREAWEQLREKKGGNLRLTLDDL